MKIHPPHRSPPTRQRGAIAVVMGLSLVALLAAVGLAVDGGRLYTHKSELQTAADACALAAVRELKCDSSQACPRTYLTHARDAGLYAASRNKAALQASNVVVPAGDVTFSTLPSSGFANSHSADTRSAYVKCVTRAIGITPWLMGAVGVGQQRVSASAVAALKPTQKRCLTAPMAVCAPSRQAAPNYGYTVGDWITARLDRNGSSANYKVVDGASIRWLATDHGQGHQECSQDDDEEDRVDVTMNLSSTDYNARFGLYTNSAPNAATLKASPPDSTGYAYPNQATPRFTAATGNAFAHYADRQTANTAFAAGEYDGDKIDTRFKGVLNSASLKTHGVVRRLVSAPIISCPRKGASDGESQDVKGVACLLLLNPIGGVDTPELHVEYLGNATTLTTPCGSFAYSGGESGRGQRAATLIQ
jgi:Putative Flp pilus-assembly TadE/G-like